MKKQSTKALALAALGVVYGDIGTSALYAFKEVFSMGQMPVTPDNVLGVLSLFCWTITVIVSLKYVCLVLRADNEGEGGLVALLTLSTHAVRDKPRLKTFLFAIGVFGTALFYGDGVITPAISVLSAVEGLALISPSMSGAILPITLLILLALFSIQHRGTGNMGRYFSPIMVLWFLVIGVLGLWQVLQYPQVLYALNPLSAWNFLFKHPKVSFVILSAVVLCVAGAEALYADLGHFGKKPIRLAWFSVAMPCLILNYLGQAALVMQNPDAVTNPFYRLAPSWGVEVLVGLAVLATIIASQALITGAFSVTRQVIQLGYLPRLNVRHTSLHDTGQIYIPTINWGLFTAIVLATALFKSSDALSEAYGVAICTDMLITTVLLFVVMRYMWQWPMWLGVLICGPMLVMDLGFWLSNFSSKFIQGGWFPLVIGAGVMVFMVTWQRGQQLLSKADQSPDAQGQIDTRQWLEQQLPQASRVNGTAVYLCKQPQWLPHALRLNWQHNHVLHQQNLFVAVKWHSHSHIPHDQRLQSEYWGHGAWHLTVHYGYADIPDLPLVLLQWSSTVTPESLETQAIKIPLDPLQLDALTETQTTYFLSRDVVTADTTKGMSMWRKHLFAHMHWNESTAAEFLNLPHEAVVEMGRKRLV